MKPYGHRVTTDGAKSHRTISERATSDRGKSHMVKERQLTGQLATNKRAAGNTMPGNMVTVTGQQLTSTRNRARSQMMTV